MARARADSGPEGARAGPDATALARPDRHHPLPGGGPPVRKSPGRRTARPLARLLAARPPIGRLPGRAARPGLRRHRGGAVPGLSPPQVRLLAGGRIAPEQALRRPRARPDRRQGGLDRPPVDQLHLRHLRPRQEGVRPRAAGRPRGPVAPRRPDRLRPVPRPPLPALEAGRFPRDRRLLRPGRARDHRDHRQGGASSSSTTRRKASPSRSSPGSRSWPTSIPRSAPAASGWPGG